MGFLDKIKSWKNKGVKGEKAPNKDVPEKHAKQFADILKNFINESLDAKETNLEVRSYQIDGQINLEVFYPQNVESNESGIILELGVDLSNEGKELHLFKFSNGEDEYMNIEEMEAFKKKVKEEVDDIV